MSLYALLRDFADAVINRTESEIHVAATALEVHFHATVEPVVAEAAKVEAAPASVIAEVQATIVAETAAVAGAEQ